VPDSLPFAERLARNAQVVTLASVVILAAVAWGWTVSGAMGESNRMAGMVSPLTLEIPVLLLMWWLMMAAMMLPSAAPAILLYGRVRQQRGGTATIAASWVFLSGYLLAWLMLSEHATVLQFLATEFGLLHPMTMQATSKSLAGATLIAAGVYQWLPAKDACLTHCRSPAAFLARHWLPGAGGALRLGLKHGLYCAGCCWLLMALLFVGGVMNFLWIAALTALVAAEKLAPRGKFTARTAGVILVLWGLTEIAA
jgi:predicted metal-binding membrane protein